MGQRLDKSWWTHIVKEHPKRHAICGAHADEVLHTLKQEWARQSIFGTLRPDERGEVIANIQLCESKMAEPGDNLVLDAVQAVQLFVDLLEQQSVLSPGQPGHDHRLEVGPGSWIRKAAGVQ